jgi:hypothetical protein
MEAWVYSTRDTVVIDGKRYQRWYAHGTDMQQYVLYVHLCLTPEQEADLLPKLGAPRSFEARVPPGDTVVPRGRSAP